MEDPNGRLAYWVEVSTLLLYHPSLSRRNTSDFICLSCLLVLAYMLPEEDRVFDLIGRPVLWHLVPTTSNLADCDVHQR